MTETAEEAYERVARAVHERIGRLEDGLREHRADFRGTKGQYGRDWGYVGDLVRIECLLAQALIQRRWCHLLAACPIASTYTWLVGRNSPCFF